jgi:hypothetical protein
MILSISLAIFFLQFLLRSSCVPLSPSWFFKRRLFTDFVQGGKNDGGSREDNELHGTAAPCH